MATRYVGWNLPDSMFERYCVLERYTLTEEQTERLCRSEKIVSTFTSRHAVALKVLGERHGLHFPMIPANEVTPRIRLLPEDSLLVISIRGIPRGVKKSDLKETDLATATFHFTLWKCLKINRNGNDPSEL